MYKLIIEMNTVDGRYHKITHNVEKVDGTKQEAAERLLKRIVRDGCYISDHTKNGIRAVLVDHIVSMNIEIEEGENDG